MKLNIVKLAKLVGEKGVKYYEIADVIGISRVSLSRIINNKQNANPKTINKLAQYFNCTFEYLIEEELKFINELVSEYPEKTHKMVIETCQKVIKKSAKLVNNDMGEYITNGLWEFIKSEEYKKLKVNSEELQCLKTINFQTKKPTKNIYIEILDVIRRTPT